MIELYSHVWFYTYDLKTFFETGERNHHDVKSEGIITEILPDGMYEVCKMYNTGAIGYYFVVSSDKIELIDDNLS